MGQGQKGTKRNKKGQKGTKRDRDKKRQKGTKRDRDKKKQKGPKLDRDKKRHKETKLDTGLSLFVFCSALLLLFVVKIVSLGSFLSLFLYVCRLLCSVAVALFIVSISSLGVYFISVSFEPDMHRCNDAPLCFNICFTAHLKQSALHPSRHL